MGSEGIYRGSRVAVVQFKGHTKDQVATILGVKLCPNSHNLIVIKNETPLGRIWRVINRRPKPTPQRIIVGLLYNAPYQSLELRIDGQYPSIVRRARLLGNIVWNQM